MDYEKKYKEALDQANVIHKCIRSDLKQVIEQIFPELAESEDEKIRKAIKKALQVRCDGSRIISDEPVTLEEAIAWLEKKRYSEFELENEYWRGYDDGEKQGEHKSDKSPKVYNFHGIEFIPKFISGDLVREKKSGTRLAIEGFSYDTGLYTYKGGQFPITIQDDYELVEQNPADEVGNYDHKEVIQTIINEQKSEWSKEDIEMIDWLIRCCEKEYKDLCNDRYGHQEIVSDLKRDCRKKWDWLESLRNKVVPHKQWKPSETDINILKDVIDCTVNPQNYQATLQNILYQLKAL